MTLLQKILFACKNQEKKNFLKIIKEKHFKQIIEFKKKTNHINAFLRIVWKSHKKNNSI